MKNTGIHIIADLYNCDFSHHIENYSLENLVSQIQSIITNGGFTVIGKVYHSFEKNAFSIVYMLSESHVSIHTWPEKGYVSFDIHTCNYSMDNTPGTEQIYKELIGIFASKEVKKNTILRSMRDDR